MFFSYWFTRVGHIFFTKRLNIKKRQVRVGITWRYLTLQPTRATTCEALLVYRYTHRAPELKNSVVLYSRGVVRLKKSGVLTTSQKEIRG